MEFEYLHKIADHALYEHGYYIDYIDKFYRFIDEYNIERVRWGQPTTISASYFLRLLQEGSSSRARGYGRGYNHEFDEASNQMSPFYTHLLDHGALWKLRNGNVICTAMPYGSKEKVVGKFIEMKESLSYPDEIQLEFLDDDKYRFRKNGDCMILIYYDPSHEEVDLNCSEEDLRRKAILHSNPGIRQYQPTSSYVRDRYVSEYAKRRAHGICQLCGHPAPFNGKDGQPFLETHHVIWLADGGEDSIENTVALCPNCHRKMHSLNLDEDVSKLLSVCSTKDRLSV
ncbi:MAG: HNH endonuclease [Anaerolineaceae bacterium]|nr:HNH endonuclease [Anaerolineaceae bacterium]